MTQSAISRQLQKLEAELDVTLLIRRPHGIELTEAGSILLEQTETLISYLAQIRDLMRGKEETFTGHAVLGVPPTSGILITPEVLGSFKARWPLATLDSACRTQLAPAPSRGVAWFAGSAGAVSQRARQTAAAAVAGIARQF